MSFKSSRHPATRRRFFKAHPRGLFSVVITWTTITVLVRPRVINQCYLRDVTFSSALVAGAARHSNFRGIRPISWTLRRRRPAEPISPTPPASLLVFVPGGLFATRRDSICSRTSFCAPSRAQPRFGQIDASVADQQDARDRPRPITMSMQVSGILELCFLMAAFLKVADILES